MVTWRTFCEVANESQTISYTKLGYEGVRCKFHEHMIMATMLLQKVENP
jgi:hypothetical protein